MRLQIVPQLFLIEIVDSFRYLGVHINNKLDWWNELCPINNITIFI